MEKFKNNDQDNIRWNYLVLRKKLKYRIDFKDLENQNHIKIASQITSDQNYKIFRRINLFFWLKFIIEISFVICLLTLFFIILYNKQIYVKHFVSLYIVLFINLFLKVLLTALSSFKRRFINWRMIYFKSKYIVDNKVDFFNKNDFILLKLNSLEKDDFFSFDQGEKFGQNREDKGRFSLEKYKRQLIYKYLNYAVFLLWIICAVALIITSIVNPSYFYNNLN